MPDEAAVEAAEDQSERGVQDAWRAIARRTVRLNRTVRGLRDLFALYAQYAPLDAAQAATFERLVTTRLA